MLDGGVVSYQVHALKPDREIYEILLEKYSRKQKSVCFSMTAWIMWKERKRQEFRAIQVTSREMLNETLDKNAYKINEAAPSGAAFPERI